MFRLFKSKERYSYFNPSAALNSVVTRRRRRRKTSDYTIVFCVVFLILIGLVMLASASSHLAQLRFGDTYYYLRHQIFYGLSFGIIGFLVTTRIYYRVYERLSFILFLISIGFLLLVFTSFGVKAGGAERWLQFGSVIFQPSEFLKITLIMYLSAWLARQKERSWSFRRGILPFIVIMGGVTFLLLQQPSTSTAIILLLTALGIYFASGARVSYILGAISVSAIILGAIIYTSPYRWARVQTFLNPDQNTQSTGYHINQTLISIGNGGLWGVGYGQSTTKVRYLPEPIGDSIFAVIAEEIGFVGVMVLIGIFFLFIVRSFYIAACTNDSFGQLMAIGFGLLIAIQSFVNIASVSGVIPLTGAPLPFISYGGTALAVFMTISGILNNISRFNT